MRAEIIIFFVIFVCYKTSSTYITDSKGKRIPVVLPIKKYEALFEELEDLRDVKLYDQAKSGKQKYIAAEDAVEYVGKKPEISQNQIAIAKSRLEAYEKDPSRGIPREKVKKEMDKKYKK